MIYKILEHLEHSTLSPTGLKPNSKSQSPIKVKNEQLKITQVSPQDKTDDKEANVIFKYIVELNTVSN